MKCYIIIILSLCSLFAIGCNDNNATDDNSATVTNLSVTPLSSTSINVSAELTCGNMKNLIKKGFCYSISADPTIYNSTISEVRGSFTSTLSNLASNTTYYIKAYAQIGDNLVYSNVMTFTTPSTSLEEQLANYVAPAYSDDYTSLASWENRSSWNLGNVHDPSVMKADDGYYYMYQTDASYGKDRKSVV